jgi:hypothetical protein
MMHIIKQKRLLITGVALLFVGLLVMNKKTLDNAFSGYIEHTKPIEPSLIQRRMAQYKQLIKAKEDNKTYLKTFIKTLEQE